MSDPVTNVEIEDVLSSIRRLVSADERDVKTGEAAGAAGTAATAAERLVLTPAQRVDDEPADASALDRAWSEEGDANPDADDDFPEVEDAEIIEASDESHDQDAPDTAERAETHVPEFLTKRHAEIQDTPDAGPAEQAADHEADEAQTDKDMLADVVEARHEGGDAEDASEDSDNDGDSDADALTFEHHADPDDRQADDAQDDVPHAEGRDDLQARIAEVEDAVAEQDEVWEPDGASDDDYAGGPVEPLPWKEMDEATGFAENPMADDDLSGHARDDAGSEASGSGTWYDDDAVLDEDALRDMVAEIVRQELQGALGERITRNVRKLVRREINRALMSQGID